MVKRLKQLTHCQKSVAQFRDCVVCRERKGTYCITFHCRVNMESSETNIAVAVCFKCIAKAQRKFIKKLLQPNMVLLSTTIKRQELNLMNSDYIVQNRLNLQKIDGDD